MHSSKDTELFSTHPYFVPCEACMYVTPRKRLVAAAVSMPAQLEKEDTIIIAEQPLAKQTVNFTIISDDVINRLWSNCLVNIK